MKAPVGGANVQAMGKLDPSPELPGATLLDRVDFHREYEALGLEGLQTVGQVRETPDATLLSFPDLGPGSVAHLRELGLP